jgi:hypothetical protein
MHICNFDMLAENLTAVAAHVSLCPVSYLLVLPRLPGFDAPLSVCGTAF